MPDKPKHAGRFRQRNKVASLAAAARRVQVAQMTKEGETAWDIAQKLGVSTKTIERDQEYLMDYVNEQARPDIEEYQRRERERLKELDDDLESTLQNGAISMKDRISLALDISHARRELLGLDAPSRSESKNLNVSLETSPEAMRVWQRALYELRQIPEAKLPLFWQRAKPIIAELEEPEVVDASYYPAPKKELTDGVD